VNQTHQG